MARVGKVTEVDNRYYSRSKFRINKSFATSQYQNTSLNTVTASGKKVLISSPFLPFLLAFIIVM